jgi:ABC-type lipoprotein release transport system permease subunit
MKLLVKLAWRNVLRNKRRTVLSGLAVGIGLASMIFVDALTAGMLESMIKTATDTFLGHGQIHADGFRDTLAVEKTIKESKTLLNSLHSDDALSAFSPRTVSYTMLSSTAGSEAVLLYGIAPETERDISVLDEAIQKGAYLESSDDDIILIGSKTAEILEVSVGDRMVITVARAYTGELSQDMFRVGGIFHMGIREADQGLAYISIDKARKLLGLGTAVHEIALRFKSLEMAGDSSLPFWKRYSGNGNEAIGWRELVPQLDSVIKMSAVSTGITMFLVFGIVALSIMNSLFMSLYERMFEFGILRAIGTRPARLASIILLEAVSLSWISILIGVILGYGVIQFFSVYGIDYRGIEFADITITEFLYPVMNIKQFTVFPFVIMLFSIIAAVYPAVFAARLTPAHAMRRSM